MKKSLRVLSVLVAATFVTAPLAACGDDETPAATGSTASSTPTASTASVAPTASTGTVSSAAAPAADESATIEQTIRTYLGTYATGDAAKACSMETAEYTAQSIAEAAKDGYVKADASCEQVVAAAVALAKAFGADFTIKSVKVKQSGDLAVAKVTYESTDLGSESYQLTKTAGVWKVSGDDDAT